MQLFNVEQIILFCSEHSDKKGIHAALFRNEIKTYKDDNQTNVELIRTYKSLTESN